MGNEGKKELHKRIYMNLLWTLMILLCIVFVVPPLIRFFMPLIVAWIIAAIANPMVRFLENKIKIMQKTWFCDCHCAGASGSRCIALWHRLCDGSTGKQSDKGSSGSL